MKSPRPLKFKYSTLTTTVSQNAEDYEAIKIEQTHDRDRWQAVELMPDEVDSIVSQIESGRSEGVVTHVSDITNKVKFNVTEKGITLIGWATDNQGTSPVGENMVVMLKLKDFNQIQDWMVRYDDDDEDSEYVESDKVQESFEAQVLNILKYNK